MSDNRVAVFLWVKERKVGSDWVIYLNEPEKGKITTKGWNKKEYEIEILEICESELRRQGR